MVTFGRQHADQTHPSPQRFQLRSISNDVKPPDLSAVSLRPSLSPSPLGGTSQSK